MRTLFPLIDIMSIFLMIVNKNKNLKNLKKF